MYKHPMMLKTYSTKPRLIIHGGAGNITRTNLFPEAYDRYATELLIVNGETSQMLGKGATALDAATHAVRLLEDCPLFNCGKGAVFTRDGTIELEASVSETSVAWYYSSRLLRSCMPISLLIDAACNL